MTIMGNFLVLWTIPEAQSCSSVREFEQDEAIRATLAFQSSGVIIHSKHASAELTENPAEA